MSVPPEFAPSEGGITAEYRQELLDDGVMPCAILALREAHSGKALAVYSQRNNRTCGLPIFDLAYMDDDETVEHFIGYRVRRRFSLPGIRESVTVHPLESNVSAASARLHFHKYPHVNKRIYVPLTGLLDYEIDLSAVTHNQLIAATDETIMCSIGSYDIDDILYQLVDIHRETLAL